MRTEAAVLLVAGLVVAAAVADATPSLEVSVPETELRVGDHLPVAVAARGSGDLLWGDLQVNVDGSDSWAVVDGPREVAGARPPAWELVLAPLRVGELALPTLTVMVRDSDSDGRSVTSDSPTTIAVASVLPEDGEAQPLPMRAPIGVGGFPWEYVAPLAVPVVALAAALAWWMRRKRPPGMTGAVPDLPPLPELERLLDRLETRLGREPSGAICDRLAGGVRRYLARQTGEPAEDMTSFELRLLARRAGWSEAARRGLQEVMGLADRVRFGRAATDESSLRAALGLVRRAARDIDVQMAAEAIEEAAG